LDRSTISYIFTRHLARVLYHTNLKTMQGSICSASP